MGMRSGSEPCRDGKVWFGLVRNGLVLVLRGLNPEPDLFFFTFLCLFSESTLYSIL